MGEASHPRIEVLGAAGLRAAGAGTGTAGRESEIDAVRHRPWRRGSGGVLQAVACGAEWPSGLCSVRFVGPRIGPRGNGMCLWAAGDRRSHSWIDSGDPRTSLRADFRLFYVCGQLLGSAPAAYRPVHTRVCFLSPRFLASGAAAPSGLRVGGIAAS